MTQVSRFQDAGARAAGRTRARGWLGSTLAGAAVLVASAAAHAVPVVVSDEFTPGGAPLLLAEGTIIDFGHNIIDDGFDPALHVIFDGPDPLPQLVLQITDDEPNATNPPNEGIVVVLDGQGSSFGIDIGPVVIDLTAQLADLQDGLLAVQLQVLDVDPGVNDVFFSGSVLQVAFVRVPEPVVALAALGLLGALGARRSRRGVDARRATR